QKHGANPSPSDIDWGDVVFEVDLLKSQEINLDYILELIFENNKKAKNKDVLVDEIRRTIRASVGNRAKESLVVEFIQATDLDTSEDKAGRIDAFFAYAQRGQRQEATSLTAEDHVTVEAAQRYITAPLRREYARDSGSELLA